MKILYIIDGLKGGGKERQLVEIIKNIDAKEFNIGIVTFNDNQHYTEEIKNKVTYFRYLKKRPTRLEPLISIWKCFEEFKPDIIHTWDSISGFYSFLPGKFYNTKHINGSIRDAGTDKGWEYKLKRFFLKKADFIISNSLAGLKAYRVNGQVIYNIIDISRFYPKVQSSDFNLVMTANFTDYKDHQTFLKAAAILAGNKIVNEVYLLGDGPHREKHIKWLKESHSDIFEKFHFPGAVYNIEEYLAKCSIGVLCSTPEYSEGLSNAVLEYMAAGLVPIVTNLGGSAEIINNGINGYLIQPGDYQSIVNLVQNIKADNKLQEMLLSNAKDTISEKFTMTNNLKKLSSFYRSIGNTDKN